MDTSLLRGGTAERSRLLSRPTSGRGSARTGPPTTLVVAAVAVVAVGVVLRFWTGSQLWLDEALSVNIARLPLSKLPDALRHDGSPPLYYVLLHFWIRAYGAGDIAVRALSGVLAVASLPLVWMAGRRIGARAGASAALVLLAASPFAIRFATEARMYSLLGVLTLAGFLALRRLLRRPSALTAAGVAVLAGLLLLTHYWSLYMVGVTAALLMVRLVRRRDRGALYGVVALAASGLFLVPWLPVFAYQAAHTGTPWAAGPPPGVVFDTVREWAGGISGQGQVLMFLLIALSVLALFARPVDGRRVELDLRTRPGVRGVTAVCFGTLFVAQLAAILFNSAFVVRYTSVVFPLFLLIAAHGVLTLTDDRVRRGALALAVVFGLLGTVANLDGHRTEAGKVAAALRRAASPGDVIAYCPDQLGPSVSRLLPPSSVVQLTFPTGGAPQFVDWVDYATRNHAARSAAFARTVVDRAGPHTLWLVWSIDYRTFGKKCSALVDRLQALRPDMKRVVKLSVKYEERLGLIRYRTP